MVEQKVLNVNKKINGSGGFIIRFIGTIPEQINPVNVNCKLRARDSAHRCVPSLPWFQI